MHHYLEIIAISGSGLLLCALEHYAAFDFVSTAETAMFGTYSDNCKKIIVLCVMGFFWGWGAVLQTFW